MYLLSPLSHSVTHTHTHSNFFKFELLFSQNHSAGNNIQVQSLNKKAIHITFKFEINLFFFLSISLCVYSWHTRIFIKTINI